MKLHLFLSIGEIIQNQKFAETEIDFLNSFLRSIDSIKYDI
jgi:hypothetical protein